MPSDWKSALLAAVRVALAVGGVGVAAATVLYLASMPPPPPESDGFAHGMAAIIGGIILVLSLGVAAVSVILPTVLGRDDPLGFNRWQRLALKAAGVLVGGGFAVALAVGSVTNLSEGAFLWLAFVALAAAVACATLVWRLGEVLARLLSRAVSDGPP
jgi:hypothetical protein